jgi:putative sigma-54 modulation protein
MEVSMEIRVQSIKFNADQKLLDFVEKKFSKFEKFYDAITGVDVALSLLPDHDNKNVKVQVNIPGSTIVVEKNAKTFEDAVVDCADIIKEKLVKAKFYSALFSFSFTSFSLRMSAQSTTASSKVFAFFSTTIVRPGIVT